MLSCFSVKFLFTRSSAAQGVVEKCLIVEMNDVSQLPRFDRPNSDTYVVLPITSCFKKWEIGGSIKQDGYEQIFVDLVKAGRTGRQNR